MSLKGETTVFGDLGVFGYLVEFGVFGKILECSRGDRSLGRRRLLTRKAETGQRKHPLGQHTKRSVRNNVNSTNVYMNQMYIGLYNVTVADGVEGSPGCFFCISNKNTIKVDGSSPASVSDDSLTICPWIISSL